MNEMKTCGFRCFRIVRVILDVEEDCPIEKPVNVSRILQEGGDVTVEGHGSPVLHVHIRCSFDAHDRLYNPGKSMHVIKQRKH